MSNLLLYRLEEYRFRRIFSRNRSADSAGRFGSEKLATPGGEEAEVESIAEKIATGHAFGKHAIELGVASKAQLKALVKRIIEGADTANDVRELSGGRVAFWDDAKKAVVIFNPNAVDKGTVFVPKQGRYYFDVVLK